MELDDELCLCFHVTKRKVINYLRVERPRRVGQLGDCFGAGTGCGWCRTYLAKLFRDAKAAEESGGAIDLAAMQGATPSHNESPSPLLDAAPWAGSSAEISKSEYARARAAYIRQGGGAPPPGATPIDAEP